MNLKSKLLPLLAATMIFESPMPQRRVKNKSTLNSGHASWGHLLTPKQWKARAKAKRASHTRNRLRSAA